jgi:hypothetical protein
MSRPSNPQPFAPTTAEVQYEAPHGLLKLRGGHDQPGTSAYPELDEKGVSDFNVEREGKADDSLPLSRMSFRRNSATSTSIGCTSGSNLLERDSITRIDLLGDLSISLLSPSESQSIPVWTSRVEFWADEKGRIIPPKWCWSRTILLGYPI